MKVVKCDICGETLTPDDAYVEMDYAWAGPLFYCNGEPFYHGDGDADFCPDCWAKLIEFGNAFRKDPHIHLVTDEEYYQIPGKRGGNK